MRHHYIVLHRAFAAVVDMVDRQYRIPRALVADTSDRCTGTPADTAGMVDRHHRIRHYSADTVCNKSYYPGNSTAVGTVAADTAGVVAVVRHLVRPHVGHPPSHLPIICRCRQSRFASEVAAVRHLLVADKGGRCIRLVELAQVF